jgi:predicted nucleic acid-binding protein
VAALVAVVDAGPLYAAVDTDDDEHERCVAVLTRPDLELVVPAMVVAEVTFLVGRRLGPGVEAAFLRGLSDFEIEAPIADDWAPMADLVTKYRDVPLGGADASVAVLADRLETDLIVTLDRRHFGALRSRSGGAYQLLPD